MSEDDSRLETDSQERSAEKPRRSWLERISSALSGEPSSREDLIELLGLADAGEGVRIYIGSENKLFGLSGSSLVVSPYRDSDARVIGVVGVIGPTRLNYARIVPVVDYTANVISAMLARQR